MGLGLAVGTLTVFLPTLRNGFVDMDDHDYVTANGWVQRGLSAEGVRWAFTTFRMGNWHPVTWLSHMLDWELWGPLAGGHHASAVLLHTATVVLLFAFFLRTTGAPGRSALVAALFAIHPLRVESVAWASERKDVLSLFFGVIALHGYVHFTRGHKRAYWVALGAYALSLASKPMLVTFPFLLLLVDVWPLQRIRRPAASLMEKLPFALLAAASSVLAVLAQRSVRALVTLQGEPVRWRLESALTSYARYLGMVAAPLDLCAYYPLRLGETPASTLLLSTAVLAMLGGAAFALRKVRPSAWVGLCWYLGTLVPVIGLVQFGNQALADRYTYLPSLGLTFGIIFALPVPQQRSLKALATGVSAAVLTVLALLTVRQIGTWRDSEALFVQALRVTAHNAFALHGMGVVRLGQGRLPEAANDFRAALQEDPTLNLARSNLGLTLLREQKPQEAAKVLEEAVAREPWDTATRYNQVLAQQAAGQWEAATGNLRALLAEDPSNSPWRERLAILLGQAGHLGEAASELEKGVALDPGASSLHFNLGITRAQAGDLTRAIPEFQTALRLRPDYPEARQALAHALQDRGPM